MSDIRAEAYGMVFEWDESKARKNVQKHGISFDEAKRVFGDPARIEVFDFLHSVDEVRYVTVGMVNDILSVVYTERNERGILRLISARKATENERRAYRRGRF